MVRGAWRICSSRRGRMILSRLRPETLGPVLLGALVLLSSCARQVETAEIMRATMYDDGLACPGGCDAHVVFAPRHNGTRNAFRPPMASRSAPGECTVGEHCMICFDELDGSCLSVLYRGGGPHEGTFDFTPAFFDEYCDRPDLPGRLAATCRVLESAVIRLGYDRRTDCFASPADEGCAEIVAESDRLKASDAVERLACLDQGEAAYNARQTDPATQRALDCNYERFGTGGPNSAGVTWRRLLPGACRQGSFVGRDGLDCCGGNLLAAAALHPECSGFFPQPGQ